MGSQLALCHPGKDLLLVTNGDTQSVTARQDIILYAFWRLVFPHISDEPLTDNAVDFAKLKNKLGSLEFPSVDGEKTSPDQGAFQGKKYRFSENPMKIKWVIFEFTKDEAIMKYENATGNHELRFGLGKYVEGIFPETYYSDRRIGQPAGRGFRCKASGSWFNPRSFTFYLYVIDNYFGTLKANCYFGENTLTLQMSKVAEGFMDEYTGMATGKED
jgi:hypothetical protein